MNKTRFIKRTAFCAVLSSAITAATLAPANTAWAQNSTAWVSDQLEITLRRGQGTQFGISAMLDSGERLQVLETSQNSGYSRVRTSGGTEGWVLSRYLSNAPSARDRLAAAQRERDAAVERSESLETRLRDVTADNAQMTARIATLEGGSEDLQQELRRVSAAAARPMEIQRRNEQLADQVRELEQSNSRLTAQLRAEQSQRENWIIGALILFGGLVLGLIAPHLRRRKSGWEGLG